MGRQGELPRRLAANLRLYRAVKGHSQESLAYALGYSRSWISQLELSQVAISISTLETLAAQLEVDPLDLLTDQDGHTEWVTAG